MLRPRVSFLFFPERLIPDSFYRDASQYQCFDRPEFKRYLLAMDEEGIWVSHVQKIVEENPHPQMNGPRPPRTLAPSLEPKPDKTSNLQDEDLTELQDLSQAIVEPRDEEYDERGSAREDLANVMRCSYSRFFAQVMTQCAQRQAPGSHPSRIFALLTRYSDGQGYWSFSPATTLCVILASVDIAGLKARATPFYELGDLLV
jgi:hypothetical protein